MLMFGFEELRSEHAVFCEDTAFFCGGAEPAGSRNTSELRRQTNELQAAAWESEGRYTVGRRAIGEEVCFGRALVVPRVLSRVRLTGVRRPTRACSQLSPWVNRRVTMTRTLVRP